MQFSFKESFLYHMHLIYFLKNNIRNIQKKQKHVKYYQEKRVDDLLKIGTSKAL